LLQLRGRLGKEPRVEEKDEELGELGYEASRSSFCGSPGWAQEWADEFDGDALDTASWSAVGRSGDTEFDDGLVLGSCRSATCRPENVGVSGGLLHLRTGRDGAVYHTAAVASRGKRAFDDQTPYRLCTSAKLPGARSDGDQQGVWPAIWMLPNNGSAGCVDRMTRDPDMGEMDLLEMLNGDGVVWSTYHWMRRSLGCHLANASLDPSHQSRFAKTPLPPDWESTFHEFAVERSTSHVAYAIDGSVVFNESAEEIGSSLSHEPFYVILNTAIGGSWPGEPSASTRLPVELLVDYVRVARRQDV
jgi:beta-glucanase (GH16 family)